MVFLYKRQNISKKKGKIRNSYQCFGCEQSFRSKANMEKHQGDSWPGCPESSPKDIAILNQKPRL